MNKETKEAFTREVMAEVLARYSIDEHNLYQFHGNENFVYRFCYKENEYILKLIHSSHRSFEQVIAEIDWILFLDKQRIPVALPLLSNNNRYVEKINAQNSYFSAVAYQKVPGKVISQAEFSPALIKQWGTLMGKMHQAAKKYKSPEPAYKRPEWNEHKVFKAVDQLPSSLQPVKDLFSETTERLQLLSKETNTYGMIHSDFHHLNFLVYNGRLAVIDFDDADYNWFINDIAKTLYNEVFNFSVHPNYRKSFASFFFKHFMSGYLRENGIDYSQLSYMEDFLQLRRAFIFIKWFQDLNNNPLNKSDSVFLARYKDDAAQKRAVLDLNYTSILKDLDY